MKDGPLPSEQTHCAVCREPLPRQGGDLDVPVVPVIDAMEDGLISRARFHAWCAGCYSLTRPLDPHPHRIR